MMMVFYFITFHFYYSLFFFITLCPFHCPRYFGILSFLIPVILSCGYSNKTLSYDICHSNHCTCEPLHCNNGIRISFHGPTAYLTWQCDLRRHGGSAFLDIPELHDIPNAGLAFRFSREWKNVKCNHLTR